MQGKLDESFFDHYPLPEGSVAVDCGASVGEVAEKLASKGATVHAFEPNPVTFGHLASRFQGREDQVKCYQKGISDHDGTAPFYLHENFTPETINTANGSSLLPFKGNVRTHDPIEIELVDLAKFLQGLGTAVDILKIDIEGAEIDVVNHLLDTGAHRLAKLTLVETHERKIPELREPTQALQERIDALGLSEAIRLDWH